MNYIKQIFHGERAGATHQITLIDNWPQRRFFNWFFELLQYKKCTYHTRKHVAIKPPYEGDGSYWIDCIACNRNFELLPECNDVLHTVCVIVVHLEGT